MTPQDDKPKQAREIHFKTYLKPEPGIVYDMNKCSLDLWRLEQRWEFVEKSAYGQAIKERDDILERYRAIELANKEMSRNDHVHFGSLLLERDQARAEAERLNIQAGIYSLEADKWKALAEKMAVVLKASIKFCPCDVCMFPKCACHDEAKEALAEFEAAKKTT